MNFELGTSRPVRLTILLAGVVAGQALLYGPSLLGLKVLLPLDTLAEPGIYLPKTPEFAGVEPHSTPLSDLVCMDEPSRRFAAREFRAGRFPMWTPYQYGGAPVIWPRFSPFRLMEWFIESPVVLAWAQLWAAIVAGLGAYHFCRRVLEVSFWPATIAGWCYPLTGFFALWQGYIICLAAYWLPWILLAVERTVGNPKSEIRNPKSEVWQSVMCQVPSVTSEASRFTFHVSRATSDFRLRTSPLAPVALSLTTCLVLISGQVDVGAQVLLVSGLYALWRLFNCGLRIADCGIENGEPPTSIPPSAIRHPHFKWSLLASAATKKLIAGWALGILLAAPAFLPVIEYTRSSARLARRSAGSEERPPVGLSALPQIVLPNMYGGATGRSLRFAPETQLESSAAAYAGLLATLLVAPLAWCSRRHRSLNLFWTLLAILGVAWCLNVPGVVQLMRLPGLNMLSYNRLVFATSFAILALMATGLEVLVNSGLASGGAVSGIPQSAIRNPQFEWRWWCWLPATGLAGLGIWCLFRAIVLPEPIQTKLAQMVSSGHPIGWVRDPEAVRQVQSWFTTQYSAAAALCAIGVFGWIWLARRSGWTVAVLWRFGFSRVGWKSGRGLPQSKSSASTPAPLPRQRLLLPLGVLLVGELLWFGYGRTVQFAPSLYYPRIPVLDEIAKSAPGRIIGFDCLPANLGSIWGLNDVRGYDAVDPVRIVELLRTAARPEENAVYAATQSMTPKAAYVPGGDILLPPVLDMLGVRYVIFRGAAPTNAHPAFASPDYWVLTNAAALSRAFVPKRVETVTDNAARLEKLASPNFDPREVAYLESAVTLPAACIGRAEIVEEVPTRVVVTAKMETAGLVILADLWDKSWRAYLNGTRVPILRANHALRAVEVPAGQSRLEFRYEPQSFAWGIRLAGAAALALAGWGAFAAWRAARPTRPS